MLQRWVAFAGTDPNIPQQQPNAAESVHKETSEHRELRLRNQYEEALRLHQNNHTESAKRQFEDIAEDLRKSHAERRAAAAEVRHRVGSKRPRQEESPLWERKLRFAVHRNLAEVYFHLTDYLRALQSYASALDDDRSDFLIWVRAARSAALCGRLHVARRAFETALTMRPGHWLCRSAYQAVLAAIGDADEDCDRKCTLALSNPSLDGDIVDMVRQRYEFQKAEEKDAKSNASEAPEVIRLDELSWACLVDALRVCLDSRLSGNPQYGTHPVAHPVTFEYSHLTKSSQQPIANASEDNSDEVMLVSDISLGKSRPAEDDEMQVVAVHMAHEMEPGICNGPQQTTGPRVERTANGERAPNQGPDDVSVEAGPCVLSDATAELAGDKEVNAGMPKPLGHSGENCGGSEPRPEIRRSSRQKHQAEASFQEADQYQTRISSGTRDSTQEDREMVQAILNMCIDEESTCPVATKKSILGTTIPGKSSVPEPETVASREKGRSCSWVTFVDEIQESAAVVRCLESFEDRNSGPADLLLRVLSSLSVLKASQYSPTLALLWSTLREKLQLHMPGSPATTALIVEAMLVSGKKAGKAKARRFQEAGRLLSHIRVSSPDEDESCFLRVRISWLWSHLYECQGEMQRAFLSAELTLVILQSIRTWKEIVPDCLGPDLSGYAFSELTGVLRRRITGLKMGRDLEKARQELSKIEKGDTEAAKRTVSILSSSVHAAVQHLELDVWRDDDLRTEFSHPAELEAWEKRLDAETELEPRLAVFGEACAKSSDFVGELVCFSVRLRMGVHYYSAKLRSEMEGDTDAGQNGTDSSSGRLADLLVQIRKYVAILKKLSAPGSSGLWNCDIGVSGWSMEKAASIAALTLVSLTALVITKIPLLRFSSTSTELGASQKNRRLGFTRCMLAFARSVLLVQRCRQNAQSHKEKTIGRTSYDSVMTKKMLYVSSFCLRALVARGCCREEGTSGALIKLYVKFLYARLQQMAELTLDMYQTEGGSTSDADRAHNQGSEGLGAPVKLKGGPSSTSQSVGSSDVSNEGNLAMKDDPDYKWTDVSVLRHELAQCHQGVYQVPELESITGDSNVMHDVRWLEDGCRVSKHIGLSFTTGDPSGAVATMDTEVCKNVYLFYRKRIFEGVCRRRRDGGRAKRLREVLSRLAESLPEDAPQGVSMLPFHALNKIVTDVVETSENISREAAENVSKLEEEWNRCDPQRSGKKVSIEEQKRYLQLSITFFEVFALHSMSTLCAYDSEYKKHKTAERRKRPKEVADRLFQASTECIIALRIRPWSVGAWILLGRIYVEIADLALDERELNLSSFGLYRPEDLQTLGDGDMVETVFGRAEACFGFAASLLKHPWARKASTEQLDLAPSEILGFSFDGNENEPWCGFGDDGDIFGSFGLTNSTTSRPVLKCESHPMSDDGKLDVRRIAAVRFGEAAISVLRLRELRYFHSHWTHSTIESRLPTHPRNRFPNSIIDLASLALRQLREGQHLMGFSAGPQNTQFHDGGSGRNVASHVQNQDESKVSAEVSRTLEWREGYIGMERLQWYYSLIEAKVMQKVGQPPELYLPVFQRSVAENKMLRKSLRQPPDIEPLYKLHVSRMKILRVVEDGASSASLLTLLEKYSFKQGPIVVRVDEEKGGEKDVEDWITERKIAIAEDILSAMQYCRDSRSEVPYAEYYFKATFCRALILSEILKDTGSALRELDKLFRTEAAAKVLDQGRDATHRGYFYKIWNYRITDTGIEPALESERKLVRWRSKILGLYGQLLQQTGEWRLLAAIIHRLKKRSSEDLPVDGALLDDLITAYAITSRASILNSMEKSILTNAAVFEASFRRTWDIYVETLRLAQGIKRVRSCLHRGDRNETGAKRLVQSGRPRCLVAIHTTLRLEHLRWQSANGGPTVDINAMRSLPMEGTMKSIPEASRISFVETLQVSVSKWALDEKMMKLLVRRISEYALSETQ